MNKNRRIVSDNNTETSSKTGSEKRIKVTKKAMLFIWNNILAVSVLISLVSMNIWFFSKLDNRRSFLGYLDSAGDKLAVQVQEGFAFSPATSEAQDMRRALFGIVDRAATFLGISSENTGYAGVQTEAEAEDEQSMEEEGQYEEQNIGDSQDEDGVSSEGENNEDTVAQDPETTEATTEDATSKPPAQVVYTEYEPTEVKSRYYNDVGVIPGTMDAEFLESGDEYFADSCWIGDSRAVGIYDYSGWNEADFFCDNGYCAYNYSKGKPVKRQGSSEKVSLEEAMSQKSYGKIYIMLGINDCGYGTTETFTEEYRAMVEMVMEAQPEATVYLVGNMHISKDAEQKANPEVYTNKNINAKNAAIASCADGVRSFYLDFNYLFTDSEGYLRDELTFDGYHLYASGYMEIIQFFKEHTL